MMKFLSPLLNTIRGQDAIPAKNSGDNITEIHPDYAQDMIIRPDIEAQPQSPDVEYFDTDLNTPDIEAPAQNAGNAENPQNPQTGKKKEKKKTIFNAPIETLKGLVPGALLPGAGAQKFAPIRYPYYKPWTFDDVDIVMPGNTDILFYYSKQLEENVAWIEYNKNTGKMMLVMRTGIMKPYEPVIQKEFRHHFMVAKRGLMHLMKDGEVYAFENPRIIVTDY